MELTRAVLILLISLVYFFPSLVADIRYHRQRLAIGVLNLFAGWTFIGWVVALVWACTADVQPVEERQPRTLLRWLDRKADQVST